MRSLHLPILLSLVFSIIAASCGEPLSPADSLSTLTNKENTPTQQESTATIETKEAEKSPTSSPTSTQEPTNTETHTPLPTKTPTLSPTPLLPILPAALYFIYPDSEGLDQIWRLELDGKTLTQISNEKLGVTGLDTSPINGRLAFVSDNNLFLADPEGENIQSLIEGSLKPADWELEETWLWTQAIANPRWSPDGTQIAVSQNGVLIIDVQTRETKKLIDNHIPPPHEIAQIMVYEPGEWSPDGENLFSKLRFYEGNAWISLPSSGDGVGNTFGWGGDHVTWNQDGQHAYVAVPGIWAYSRPGLWLSDTRAPNEQYLSEELDPQLTTGWPIQTPNGQLQFFMGGGIGYAQDHTPLPMMMYTSSAYTLLDAQSMRNERHLLREAVWAPEASFAIVYTQSGELILLPSDQRPTVPLIELGDPKAWDFRWGIPTSGDWQLTSHPGLEAEPTPIADCPGTPNSRLVIGDQARVTYTDGRRLRVRSSAEIVAGNIVRELIEGTRFAILDGPECVTLSGPDQAYIFWQLFIPDYNIIGWAAEGAIEGGQDVYYIERWP